MTTEYTASTGTGSRRGVPRRIAHQASSARAAPANGRNERQLARTYQFRPRQAITAIWAGSVSSLSSVGHVVWQPSRSNRRIRRPPATDGTDLLGESRGVDHALVAVGATVPGVPSDGLARQRQALPPLVAASPPQFPCGPDPRLLQVVPRPEPVFSSELIPGPRSIPKLLRDSHVDCPRRLWLGQ